MPIHFANQPFLKNIRVHVLHCHVHVVVFNIAPIVALLEHQFDITGTQRR